MAERHERLWSWFEALTPGIKPRPRVEIWPRGGAKSSTGELGCCYLAGKLTRRFVLYLCATQDQSDLHVQSIASLLETVGVERALNKYGTSKGWRREQLRTKEGFNVAGYGLDAAARGIKIDHYRPDLIICDDIDDSSDSPETVRKKIRAITNKVLPAGASDCAILFLQNLIHNGGVVCQLVDGRADFLKNRELIRVEPAIDGLKYEVQPQEDGSNRYVITGGTPTWAGQSLKTCEEQLNEWGEKAFLAEAQQEVYGTSGQYFKALQFREIEESAVPRLIRIVLAWDLAATEGGGDYTVAVLMGLAPNGNIYILNVWRGQWSSETVEDSIVSLARDLKQKYPNLRIRVPNDPGQAGTAQVNRLRKLVGQENVSFASKKVTGKKHIRSRGYAARVNRGGVFLVRGDWNRPFSEEHRLFREDEKHEYDDQVDAATDGHDDLVGAGTAQAARTPEKNQRKDDFL